MWRSILVALLILGIPLTAHAGSGLASFKACRACHSDIFELWKHSLHGQSYSDPPFQAAYMKLMLDVGRDSTRLCLRCHAPSAYIENDSDPNSQAAAEGISCAFCHSVSSINEGNHDDYYNLDTSGTVYGPYPPGTPAGHLVVESDLHRQSRFCAGCHEFANVNGVMLLETYSEWKASPYPNNNVNCQNCHMPIMYDLKMVDNQNSSDHYVTAHEFRGGHSAINLAHAVKLETHAARVGRTVNVEVTITNAESGHKLPTGIPIRKLVLNVVMKTPQGAEIASGRKVYRKVLCDKYGAIIENVIEMFVSATRVFADNRIAPKESRTEHFTFELPEWASHFVIEAALNYEYSRPVLTEESISIEMAKNIINSKSIN
ncbi:MAG: hypothetical protein HZB43_01190 [candidate division Zixibacteria bacterium]|nr:hypothetical protein [candidate division Zixibacteria bacterium]